MFHSIPECELIPRESSLGQQVHRLQYPDWNNRLRCDWLLPILKTVANIGPVHLQFGLQIYVPGWNSDWISQPCQTATIHETVLQFKKQIIHYMGFGWVLRHAGTAHAFLCFLSTDLKFCGSPSIRIPSQPRFCSMNSVFERISPSNAPHSIKKPFRCETYKIWESLVD